MVRSVLKWQADDTVTVAKSHTLKDGAITASLPALQNAGGILAVECNSKSVHLEGTLIRNLWPERLLL